MHRQSRQCLAASEPYQQQPMPKNCMVQPSTAGFRVKQVYVPVSPVTAAAASTHMPMHTCSVSMPCVVHMPCRFPKSRWLRHAALSCTRHFWCQGGDMATMGPCCLTNSSDLCIDNAMHQGQCYNSPNIPVPVSLLLKC